MNSAREFDEKHDANRSFLRYQLVLVVLFPVLLAYTVIQAFKYSSLSYLRQRLGFYRKPDRTSDIWIHAASVGEVGVAILLIKALQAKYPEKYFTVTTTTPTGAALFKQKNIANTRHQFLSLDYRFMVSRLLKRYQPKCALIVETEIWPNLFRLCLESNIPLCTVNGRISRKTLDTSGWIRSLYQSTLSCSSMILTRSDNDTKAYVALGANPDRVKTIGNIKFSIDVSTPKENRPKIGRSYVLAASTREGEELLLARQWARHGLKLLNGENTLLIIAPRHPQRLHDIIQQLKPLQLNIAVRSQQENITDDTDIYIADTVGELIDFMADACIIFVGGSLVSKGGHNIIEPAALGKPVLFGPYMENFETEAELLIGFSAAVQAENIDQLGDILEEALTNLEKYKKMGAAAKKLVDQHKDMASRYVAALEKYIPQTR